MAEQTQPTLISSEPFVLALSMAQINFDNEEGEGFFFFMISGNQGRHFYLNPKHAKRFHLALTQQVEAYEKKFGHIEAELPKTPERADSTVGFQQTSNRAV